MARRPQRRPVLCSPEPIRGLVGRVDCAGGPAGRPTISRDDWEAAVGARIAERAQPVELDRGTLTVRVATSVWASELSLLAAPILVRLTARGVHVHALRCRVGPVTARLPTPARRATRAVPPPRPLPAALERALADVPDDELRATIGAAARANLAWQTYVADVASEPGTSARTGGSRAARVPQSAETESDLLDRTTGGVPGAPPRKPSPS